MMMLIKTYLQGVPKTLSFFLKTYFLEHITQQSSLLYISRYLIYEYKLSNTGFRKNTFKAIFPLTGCYQGREKKLKEGGSEYLEKYTPFVKFFSKFSKRGGAKDRRPPPSMRLRVLPSFKIFANLVEDVTFVHYPARH